MPNLKKIILLIIALVAVVSIYENSSHKHIKYKDICLVSPPNTAF